MVIVPTPAILGAGDMSADGFHRATVRVLKLAATPAIAGSSVQATHHLEQTWRVRQELCVSDVTDLSARRSGGREDRAGMSAHLGYDKHDRMGRMVENSRNGSSVKTVRTEIGDVTLAVPGTARVAPSR
jgi:hypothetical protein